MTRRDGELRRVTIRWQRSNGGFAPIAFGAARVVQLRQSVLSPCSVTTVHGSTVPHVPPGEENPRLGGCPIMTVLPTDGSPGSLDRSGSTPLYIQLANVLRDKIE